jgi:GntR family transcriptional regulator
MVNLFFPMMEKAGTAIAITSSKMLIQVKNTSSADRPNVLGPLAHERNTGAVPTQPANPLPGAFDHASPVPLYAQIREALRARILDGTYRGDGKMPSESDMVNAFDVSRVTVRQALNDLQKEGLVFKIHGKGTFAARPKAVQNLMRLEGFGEAMSAAGHQTHSKVLGYRVMRPGRHIASRLAIAEDADVMEIRRVRYLDRDPISLDVTYVPADLGRRLVREDLPRRDVFLILENDYGFRLERAELRIEATLADHALAEVLAVSDGAPVLRIERLTITAPDRPIDFEYLYYRGDAFQTFMMVGRRGAPSGEWRK